MIIPTTCKAHWLLCASHSGRDTTKEAVLDTDAGDYDPLEGIDGAAAALAEITTGCSVKFLGSHETLCPTVENEPEPLYDEIELVGGKFVVGLYYTPVAAFGDRRFRSTGSVFYSTHDEPDDGYSFVLRIDLHIVDPEAPGFTNYLLCEGSAQ